MTVQCAVRARSAMRGCSLAKRELFRTTSKPWGLKISDKSHIDHVQICRIRGCIGAVTTWAIK